MSENKLNTFTAQIHIIGINPFVFIPETVLQDLFTKAKKEKGKIPVNIKIDGYAFKQTLIKYDGSWRLYLNAPMRKAAGKEVGDNAVFEITLDLEERILNPHPKLDLALNNNKEAKEIFNNLAPYLQKEIIRYISNLKTEHAIERNVIRTIAFLLGKERFIGRDRP